MYAYAHSDLFEIWFVLPWFTCRLFINLLAVKLIHMYIKKQSFDFMEDVQNIL